MKEETSQEADPEEEEEEETQPMPPQGREAEATEGQSWLGVSLLSLSWWKSLCSLCPQSPCSLRVQFSCSLVGGGREGISSLR